MPVNVTLSMGLAVADCAAAPEPEKLLYQADMGLYKAKHNGRNCVEQIEEIEPVRSR